MSCVNPNDPRFLEILQQVGNPLLAEIEFDRLYPDPNESLYQTIATSISEEEFTAQKLYSKYVKERGNEDIEGFKEYIKDTKRQSILAIGYQKEAADNTYVPLSEEHKQLLESARENLNPVEADRVEQMLKGETRFLDDSNFEMC